MPRAVETLLSMGRASTRRRYLLGTYCVPGFGLGKTDSLILWKSRPKGEINFSCLTESHKEVHMLQLVRLSASCY